MSVGICAETHPEDQSRRCLKTAGQHQHHADPVGTWPDLLLSEIAAKSGDLSARERVRRLADGTAPSRRSAPVPKG